MLYAWYRLFQANLWHLLSEEGVLHQSMRTFLPMLLLVQYITVL